MNERKESDEVSGPLGSLKPDALATSDAAPRQPVTRDRNTKGDPIRDGTNEAASSSECSDSGDEDEREFYPTLEHDTEDVPLERLVVYNRGDEVFHLQVMDESRSSLLVDTSSLVIYVDGACRWNQSAMAMSSYGVFFGPDSHYNRRGLILPPIPQTSVRAEFEALAAALNHIPSVLDRETAVKRIFIACDCEAVIMTMCWKFEEPVPTSRIRPDVEVADDLRSVQIYAEMLALEEKHGVTIKMWQIPREDNEGADELAKEAIDEELDRWAS
ncbi:Ribonuclease H1 [Sphaceloma murrayae]|uniref:Ribonuclease H1 n=1 Tax=Sphaceloma murrayae TaxID=2082308 RepID=A0A2K1QTG8_9PEZI|nr:Ribonuclease H1 [Sphaceloma murrayae]